jgi:uncharacterized protein YjdB
MRPRLVAAAALTIFAIAACTDSDSLKSTSPHGESKLFVALSVDAETILESTSITISARVTDQAGFVQLAPVTWKSSNPSVASVSGGTITGVAPGTAMVIASAGTGADSAIIQVTAKEYTLDLQPSAAVVAQGDTVQFIATFRTQNGDIIPVSNLSWRSSDTVAARFVTGGALVARAEGELMVSAETANKKGSGSVRVLRAAVASVTISPSTANVYVGDKLELDVTLRDHQGRLLGGDVTFGSSDYSKASVNQDGIVTGVAAGNVVISATSGTKTGSATITVLGLPAASVRLDLASDTVPVGVEVQATAVPLDESGNPLAERTIAYQSQNPSVATVTSEGIVKGIADGSTNISAIVDGKFASAPVTVSGRQATSISITPESPTVSVGHQSQLTARVLDQAGTEIIGQPITWASGNQGVALVSSSGLVSAVSAGMAPISATSGSLSASVTVSVVSSAVASVQVSPTSASVVLGGAPVALTATAFDADGKVLEGRAATWSSQNPTVASVSSSGVVTALGTGSTTVTANVEGKTASATVTVGTAPAAPVVSVTVTLGVATLNVGQQTQASAVLKDAQGNVLNRPVTWSTLDTAVAKVNASGVVTAYAGGTVAIMARSEGISGSASLTVNTPSPTPVAQVVFDVPATDLLVGQSVQSVITLKDAENTILTGRTITYTTDNSSVVTVSAAGLITAVGPGTARVSATSGGVSASKSFTVKAPTQTVATITVTPAPVTLAVGQTSQETAVARDAQGSVIGSVSFTWTTSNPAVAVVSSAGMVSAVASGTATISAVASGVTGSTSATVTTQAAPPPTDAAGKILALLGPTKTVAQTATIGTTFAFYDTIFNKYLPPTTETWGDYYYDRGVVYYARYARTGDPAFLARGHKMVLLYRQGYLEPNGLASAPHWSFARGLELHYRVTGDTLSRRAILGMWDKTLYGLIVLRTNGLAQIEDTQISWMENRIQARALQVALSLHRMGVSYQRASGWGGSLATADWPTRLRYMLDKILSTQNANGSWSWVQICGGQLNYMVGLLNDVLIEYYRDFEPDPRIPVAIEKANEYLWTTQWRPADGAFNYASVPCSPNPFGKNVGGPTPAGDLNGLLIASYGWLSNHTGDPKWRTRGDAIMAGMLQFRWYSAFIGSKQFNQGFAESYRYLGWR